MSTRPIRVLVVALGAAASLAVAGCDDEPPTPPPVPDNELPTLERTAPGLP